MKRQMKTIIISVAVVLIGLTSYYVMKHQGITGGGVPDLSPRLGESTASAEYLNAQKAVGFYRDEIRKKPEVVKNYVQLAQLFLQEARVTGNHHVYVPKAQALIDEALRRSPEDFEARITKASMCMTLHQFSEARHLAEWAVRKNPYSSYAFGVLVDALVESGEYDEAVRTCDKLLAIRPDLRSYARASYLRELHGDVHGAADAMKLAADAGVSGQENRAWALYNLGKLYFTIGRLDTAEFIFKGILEERPNYAYAMSGLAQIETARGNNQRAIELLSQAAERTPEHVFLEQLADIYRATGEADAERGTTNIVLKMYDQHERGGWNIDREYAMFCANHELNLPEALERATNDYRRRPNNIDALDTYAWTLFKNGKAAEAVQYIESAMRLGTRSPVLQYHAGMIYLGAGQREKASSRLTEALSMNEFFHPLFAENARKTIASLNQLVATPLAAK